MSPPIRLALTAIALAILWVALLYHAAVVRLMFTDLHMNDFGKFYYSARQFLDGADMYAPNAATLMPVGDGERHEFLNMNPPHFHLPLLPLARLSPAMALGLWAAGSVMALLGACAIAAREARLRITALQAAWLAAGLALFAGTGTLVITGQVSLFLMLVAALAWAAARRERWTAAGAWLGLLAGVKPFVLIFVPWLAARRAWRSLGAMAAAIGLSFAAGLVVFGADAHASWLRTLGTTDWTWAAMNASLLGALSRWLSESPYFTPIVAAPGLVRPLWLIGAGAIGLVTLVAAVRFRGDGATDRAFALLFLGALLVSPLGWVYYWWLAVPPLAALPLARPHPLFRAAIPGLFVPLVIVALFGGSAWGTLTLGSTYFWTTLLVWAAVIGARGDLQGPQGSARPVSRG